MRFRSLPSLILLALPAFAQSPVVPQSTAAPALVADPTHLVRDSRGGGGRAFTIASTILRETRHVGIALPPSFTTSAPARRYPVVVVLDGEAYLAPTAAVEEELARHGLVPEAVIVALENEDPYRGRVHDLTPPGLSVSGSGTNEGGDHFLDFIERELLPAVERQFRGGAPRVLVGHSSGGILATYAAATRPGFRAVVAIDAPIHLGEDWLAKRLLERARRDSTPLRFAYYQARFPWPDSAWAALATAAPKTWRLQREKLEHEGHETVYMLAAYLGLRDVFAEWSRLAAPVAPTTRILPYYEAVSRSFGAPMVPPRRLVRDVVDDLLMEGRGAAARTAYGMLVAGYGAPADSAALLAQIAEVERRPPPTETVEGLLATPFPSPAEIRPFLGDWRGDTWMTPDMPRTGREILHVRLREGRVVVEHENPAAPPGYRIRRAEYVVVTPRGLSFGWMNGMRPRGVILYEGALRGDTLSGTSRFGGVDFRYPPDVPKPEPGFRFVRVRE